MKYDPKIHKIDAPKSFNDSFWIELAKEAEIKNNLPKGSLRAILKAEATDHGEVSSKGAYTPFQISRKTRDSILAKDGYDAYESPENAVKAAVQVYKDGLSYSGGDPIGAAKFYNGGGDGKKSPSAKIENDSYANKFGSFFKRIGKVSDAVADELPKEDKPKIHPDIIEAYRTGQMTPEDAKLFEKSYPQYIRGEDVIEKAKPEVLHPDVIEARNSGKMSEEDAKLFDEGVASGAYIIPKVETAEVPKPQTAENYFDTPESGSGGAVIGQGVIDSITGGQKNTEELSNTASQFPSFTNAPEFASANLQGFKNTAASIFSNPAEIAKMAASSGMQVSNDEGGNYFLKSKDGNTYSVHSGYSPEDNDALRFGISSVPYTAMGLATGGASIPVQMAGQGMAQLGIEKLKGNAGLDPSVGNIAVSAAVPAVTHAAGAYFSNSEPVAQIGKVFAELNPTEQLTVLRSAANGDKNSLALMAQAAKESPDVLKAYANLGVADLMPSGAAATDKNFQGIMAYALSEEGGAASQAFKDSVKEANQKVTDVVGNLGSDLNKGDTIDAIRSSIDNAKTTIETGIENTLNKAEVNLSNIGAASDVDAFNTNAKKTLEERIAAAKTIEKDNYPKGLETHTESADNWNKYIERRIEEVGSYEKLSPAEKKIDARLKSKTSIEEIPPEEGTLAWDKKDVPDTVEVKQHPTYTVLEEDLKDLRKSRYDKNHEFNTLDDYRRNQMEAALAADQRAFVESGAGKEGLDSLDVAHKATSSRKEAEGQIYDLFGKSTDGSMLPQIKVAVRNASLGDGTKLNGLLETIPVEHQPQAIATSFNLAVKNPDGTINPDKFIRTFEGLKSNKDLYSKTMGILGSETESSLNETYNGLKGLHEAKQNLSNAVSDNISSLIENAVKNASTGDSSALKKLLDATPDELKKDALGHSLASFITDSSTGELSFSKFTDFYRNLREHNPEAYKTIIKTLDADNGHQIMQDVFLFSKNMLEIEKAIGSAKIAEGGLVGDIKSQKNSVGAIASGVGRFISLTAYKTLNMPLSASSISGTLNKYFADDILLKKNVASMMASPEFKQFMYKAATSDEIPATFVKKLSGSKKFSDFAEANGLTDKEKWINSMIQTVKQNTNKDTSK